MNVFPMKIILILIFQKISLFS